MKHRFALFILSTAFATSVAAQLAPAVAISEIMYHPIEAPAFNGDGTPVMDLSEEVHEFVELFNTATNSVDLGGWKLSGGISFAFPQGAVIPAKGFLVVAKNPARFAAVAAYGLSEGNLFGPYSGELGNSGDTLRLRDGSDAIIDAVSYSASMPWPISADALGAEDEFTGLNSSSYQYRGRSLERVSFTHPANDPANWLASPLFPGPSPGRTNFVQMSVPRPVVISFTVLQQSDGESLIRANQPVRIECAFSGTNLLSNVSLEYFVDNIDATNESRTVLSMTPQGLAGEGRFAATLPGQPDRSIVRFRFRGDRGGGVETVSPRSDDPFQWHACFVTPQRSSTKPTYDLFISQASLNTLSANVTQNPRRVTPPDPPGFPRASWNATEPAVFVYNGVVRDIRVRHHGSKYSRSPSRFSMKWKFPRYARFDGRAGIFETDKRDFFIAGHGLFTVAGLPTSRLQHVNVYLNNNAVMDRLEQEENDDAMLERYHDEQHALNPDLPREPIGEIYKCEGILPSETDGPYGVGNCSSLSAVPLYWTPLQRYEYTYALQNGGWKGYRPIKDLLDGMWAARGDSPGAPNPNVPAVRAWLQQNFDVDATLTYMAIREWGGAYDHITQNYFLWRRANGKWALLPWDFDDEYYLPFINWSVYQGEVADANGTERGPNYLYDSIYKAFREEYKQRLFLLNNTLLNPTNITQLGYGSFGTSDNGGTLRQFADQRFPIVNQKLGLGVFYRPQTPINQLPANGSAVLPNAALGASPYMHTANPPRAHASTAWFIRSANGTYAAPVMRIVSTTNLTTLPVPFDRLAFGETYFWKCIYTDADGHPSVESVETSFVFGSAPVILPLVSIDATTLWKYDQSGSPPATNWNQPPFDDSAWPSGPALLAQENCGCLPEPIRTTLTLGNKITIYFRTRFVFSGSIPGVTLRLRQVIDDGVVFYLNGVEVSRSRLPSGTIKTNTLASPAVIHATYEGPFTIPAASLLNGTNVLAAEVHQNVAGSADVTFGATLEAVVPSSANGSIVLSEILADNRGAVVNGDGSPDYVELYNSADLPQNIGGMSLSDHVTDPGRFVFPTNTIMAPRSYLVLWCDDDTSGPGLHTGFGLDNDGQTVALFNATSNGWQLADSVTFGLQTPNFSIGRMGNEWQLNVPTPGDTNFAASLSPPTAIKINEWMATATGGPDWFELFNTATQAISLGGLFLSDSAANLTNTAIVPFSFIGPRGFRQFIADGDLQPGARHVDFKLSASGEAIILSNTNHTMIDQISFGPQTVNVSQGRVPDGSTNIASFPGSASPERPNYLVLTNLVVSEVLSHSAPPSEDQIELQNLGPAPLDIGGWWLSDDEVAPQKYRIPQNTTIAAGAFAVFSESQFNGTNAVFPFALNGARGDEVFLSAADEAGNLTGPRTGVTFGAAENGVSHGRIPTSVSVDFTALASKTFGASNAPPLVGPVVISEIQYHPPDLPGDNDNYEFIELQNISGTAVPLFDTAFPTNCWRLRDAVRFDFPTNVTLASNERVVIVGFDPVTNASALASFRTGYGTSPAWRLFGPYHGKLDNSGANLELVKPDAPLSTPGPDFGYVPAIVVDRVHYSDAAPWPSGADGIGSSLQRRSLYAYGNDPTNWFANGATPGNANISNAMPLITITGPASGSVFPPGVPIDITTSASDADGTVQRVEFLVDGTKIGEKDFPPFSFTWYGATPGAHILTARAYDNSLATAVSAPVGISLTNRRPSSVVLLTPANGASFTAPTNIWLQAQANDPDGNVQRVEFYSDGTNIGAATNAPFVFNWLNPGPGAHVITAVAFDTYSLSVTSSPAIIAVTGGGYIAYNVSPGTVGAQVHHFGLGMDFVANQRVLVTRLGVFDSGGDGIAAGVMLTAQLYNRDSGALLATLTFDSASPGILEPGTSSRFKPLSPPVVLAAGVRYDIAAYGYSSAEPDGNVSSQTQTWTTNSGAGALTFIGSGYYNLSGPGTIPSTADGGPADRYAAGTFEFAPLVSPTIIVGPSNATVLSGQTATINVTASGTAPLSYRWFREGTPFSAQTNAALTLTNVQQAGAGNYLVVVTNFGGAVTSQVAVLTVLADDDHDGMADAWESMHGLNTAINDAGLDADADGATNLEEYLAGTDPQNASSYLKLTVSRGAALQIEFLAVSNKTYSVLWRPTLNSNGWNKFADAFATSTNRVVTVFDLGITNGQRFYRLVTPQVP